MNSKTFLLCTAAVLLSGFSTQLLPTAQGQIWVPAPLSAQVRAAKGAFAPLPADALAQARYKLDWALYELDLSLFTSGEANRTLWWNYLKWKELHEQLAKPNPDISVLQAVWEQFRQNETGLELKTFTAVRDALRKYMIMLEVTADKDMAAAFQERIEQLAGELDTYEQNRNVDNLLLVAQSVGWFEKRQQIPSVISAIRSRHQQDNLRIFISERLLSRNINRSVDQTSDVRDCILGTTICGTATMHGHSTLRMVPCATHARLDIVLNGMVNSDTIGYNRSVQIYSTGNTTVSAFKTLLMSPDFISALPAVASCRTSTSINNITASRFPRIVTKIAWKKAGQSKAEAEAIASERAEDRIAKQIDEESSPLIERQNRELQDMKFPLVRTNSMPQRLSFSSTNHELVAHILRIGFGQLGTDAPPPSTTTPWDITAQIHETAVVNYGETYLANSKIDKEKLDKLRKDADKKPAPAKANEEEEDEEDDTPWEITFADQVPLRAKFNNDTVRIAIRGKRFIRDGKAINDLMEISAEYRVELTPTGSVLRRIGRVDVEYPNLKQTGAQQVIFRTFFKRVFEKKVFKETIESDGVELTGRAANIGDRLQLKHATFQNAWATVGLNSAPKIPKVVRTPTNTVQPFVDPNDTPAAREAAAKLEAETTPPATEPK